MVISIYNTEKLDEIIENSSESDIIKSKNYAKPSEIFDFDDVTTEITPELILDELEKSEIGMQTISILKSSGIKPILDYSYKNFDYRGEQQGDIIKIFIRNIPNPRVAAQTIIHETTHFYFNIGQCQWAESVCFAREKMFLTGRKLTVSERRYIINLAKQAYPEFRWKKGGYGYGEGKKFN